MEAAIVESRNTGGMVMIEHDYHPFGAYYRIAATFSGEPEDYRNGQPILYGSPRLHYIRCADDVHYVRLAKDPDGKLFDIDLHGEFLCDFRLDAADEQPAAMAYLSTGDKSGFHPVTEQIISSDESQGMNREQILEQRAGIMSVEFLGFVPDHVFMVRPELAGSDVVATDDGVFLAPRFNPGSWYLMDNPEFLGEVVP